MEGWRHAYLQQSLDGSGYSGFRRFSCRDKEAAITEQSKKGKSQADIENVVDMEERYFDKFHGISHSVVAI